MSDRQAELEERARQAGLMNDPLGTRQSLRFWGPLSVGAALQEGAPAGPSEDDLATALAKDYAVQTAAPGAPATMPKEKATKAAEPPKPGEAKPGDPLAGLGDAALTAAELFRPVPNNQLRGLDAVGGPQGQLLPFFQQSAPNIGALLASMRRR